MISLRPVAKRWARAVVGWAGVAALAASVAAEPIAAPTWQPRPGSHARVPTSGPAGVRVAERAAPSPRVAASADLPLRYGRPWPTASQLRASGVVVSEQPAPPEEVQAERAEAADGAVEEYGGEEPWEASGECDPWDADGTGWACAGTGWPWWRHLTLHGGVHAFKGPTDQGQNGNFGLHEGINATIPLSYLCNIGLQVGANFVHSDFSGTNLERETRTQTFFTAGLFHRNDMGLQYGAVFDWLHDEFNVEQDVHQVRGEISILNGCGREIGAWVAVSSADDQATETTAGAAPVAAFWNPVDQFALFYRVRFPSGGEGRIWGGGTADKDGIVGGEALVPFSDRFALQVVANYLIPEESEGMGANAGHVNEAWGIGINLVWYPGARAYQELANPFRPLFNVADNATMIIDRVAQ